MQIDHSTRDGCVVVTFTGPINLFSAPQIQRVLLKDLSRQPYGIICDLTGVDALDPVCATLFSTVANHPSSHWPATSFLLCGAQPAVAEILGGLQAPHFLRLYATVDDALDQVDARPPYLRDELRLAPTLAAPAAARRFVREVLQDWQLDLSDQDVMDRAQLLADELVTNAVVHARTAIRLRLELRGERLHIGVHDAGPGLLHLVPTDPDYEGGRGLQLVKEIAKAWGVHHHPAGGKVVWCTLDL